MTVPKSRVVFCKGIYMDILWPALARPGHWGQSGCSLSFKQDIHLVCLSFFKMSLFYFSKLFFLNSLPYSIQCFIFFEPKKISSVFLVLSEYNIFFFWSYCIYSCVKILIKVHFSQLRGSNKAFFYHLRALKATIVSLTISHVTGLEL